MGLTSTSYNPKEVRATGDESYFYAIPVTIASGAGVLDVGTVLGKISVGGKYKAYANGNSDGSEVAVGILTERVDATSADVTGIGMWVMGFFKEEELTGLDSAGKTDLASRSYSDGTIRL